MLIAYTAVAAEQTSITIYNDDFGVVRQTKKIKLEKGISDFSITGVAELINPTSVHIKLDGEILEQNYKYDLISIDKVLERYIDQEVTLVGENATITGKLLSAKENNIVLQTKDGGLKMLTDIRKYYVSVATAPVGFVTRPTLLWKVNAPRTGEQEVELTYQTNGINWHAEYVVVLNDKETQLDINAWVNLDNQSGANYENAQVKLMAGDINRARRVAYDKSQSMSFRVNALEQDANFAERAFFEYHLYELQYPTTIANNETKQVSMFEQTGVKFNKIYTNTSYLLDTYENQNSNVSIEFQNSKENKLGIPIPSGTVRIFKEDGKSSILIGEDAIKHTPKDEKITLNIGKAFDVLVNQTLVNTRKISDRVMEYETLINLKNHKDTEIEIDIIRNIYGQWEILKSSHDYKKESANQVIFKVKVKPNSNEEIKLKVRVEN
jgi:hypothetical protein